MCFPTARTFFSKTPLVVGPPPRVLSRAAPGLPHAWSKASLYQCWSHKKHSLRVAPLPHSPTLLLHRVCARSAPPAHRSAHSSVNYALFSSLAPLTGTTTSPSSSRAGSASACCCRGEVCILSATRTQRASTPHTPTPLHYPMISPARAGSAWSDKQRPPPSAHSPRAASHAWPQGRLE